MDNVPDDLCRNPLKPLNLPFLDDEIGSHLQVITPYTNKSSLTEKNPRGELSQLTSRVLFGFKLDLSFVTGVH